MSYRLLLIDDDHRLHDLLLEYLSGHGYSLSHAPDGPRGLVALEEDTYDAILLDVDNGPDGLTAAANDRLYDRKGLDAARAALKPGGILAVWSAGSDDAFTRRLRSAGFSVEEVAVRARDNGKGPRHVIWFAQKG